MATNIVTATDATFAALIAGSTTPVLVDFWAEWCGPCKALAPVLDELAAEYADEMTIAKIDIVANEEAARAAGAQSIPLLVIYRDGQEVARQVGMATKSRLAAFIEEHLA